MSADLTATLAEIDDLRAKIEASGGFRTEQQQMGRELLVEAIYHTNHIEGNPFSLPEVRAIVENFWAQVKYQTGEGTGKE